MMYKIHFKIWTHLLHSFIQQKFPLPIENVCITCFWWLLDPQA